MRIFKVIEQFEVREVMGSLLPDPLSHPVQVRISEQIVPESAAGGRFEVVFSHWCRPNGRTDVYRAWFTETTLEAARANALEYLRNFTHDEVTPNEDFYPQKYHTLTVKG